MALKVASPCYVLGYPHGISAGGLPIWKKASIASEPTVLIHGMQMFLIDSATRSGMSGAPVLLYERGGYTNENGGTMSGSVGGNSNFARFIGVYSGREGTEEANIQLGRVFRKQLIEELFANPNPGDFRNPSP